MSCIVKIAPKALALLALATPGTGQQELFKLLPFPGEMFDTYGWSVFLDDGLALVGAPGRGDSGTATLFDGTTGQELFELVAADATYGDKFGKAVCLDGGLALVGAEGRNFDAGIAYTFDATSGHQLRKLYPNGSFLNSRFGCSVALGGGLALVGALYDHTNGLHAGAAYLFDAASGQQLFKLLPSDGSPSDTFGHAVATDGTRAAVGAPWAEDNGVYSGAVYVFDTATGQELMKLVASDWPSMMKKFGSSVSLDGGLLLVGAWQWGAGAAYVFDAATGQELRKLVPSDGVSDDHFGYSVSLDGNLALVGSLDDDDHGSGSGSAYLFDATTGEQLAKLTPSDGSFQDQFGNCVSLDGGLALVAAYHDGELAHYCGSAYVFTAMEPGRLVGNGDSGCPCGNDNNGSNEIAGCANGVSGGGAFLRGSGTASVAADDLVLTVCDQEAGSFMLWFQAARAAVNPAVFGDGLSVAVGAPVVHLGYEKLSGASGDRGCASTAGLSLVSGGNVVPGQSVCYQTWFRDSTGLPCGNFFNTSNGYVVTWTP